MCKFRGGGRIGSSDSKMGGETGQVEVDGWKN